MAAEIDVLRAVVDHTDFAVNSVLVAGIAPVETVYSAVARTEAHSAVRRSDYCFVLRQQQQQHELHGRS